MADTAKNQASTEKPTDLDLAKVFIDLRQPMMAILRQLSCLGDELATATVLTDKVRAELGGRCNRIQEAVWQLDRLRSQILDAFDIDCCCEDEEKVVAEEQAAEEQGAKKAAADELAPFGGLDWVTD